MKSFDDLYIAAASVGNISIIKYLITRRRPKANVFVDYTCRFAQLECLKYLKDTGFPITSNALRNAVVGNNASCLKYILESYPNPTTKFELADTTISKAACKGYTECVELLLKAGYRVTIKDLVKVASKGRIDALKMLKDKYNDFMSAEVIVAMTSHIDSLKYLKEANLGWNQNTIKLCVKSGNIKCIEYCIEKGLKLTPEMMNLASKPQCRKFIAGVLGL